MNTKNKYDVGTLHKSFNGTMVEVLEVIKGSKRRVRFLEDNSETICTTNSLRDGNLVNRNTFIEKYSIVITKSHKDITNDDKDYISYNLSISIKE